MASGGSSSSGDDSRFHSLQQFDEQSAKRLGKGAFGNVKAMKSLDDGITYAVKCVNIEFLLHQAANEAEEQKLKNLVFNEAKLMKQVEHDNIVKCFGSFLIGSEDAGKFYIVMEYCVGGSLLHEIENSKGHFAEDQILDWSSQILFALRYLHQKLILHRDIKAENIFLDAAKKIAKIGDFGISKSFNKTSITSSETAICTVNHTAPEILLGGKWNWKADVWSLGIVVYRMCARQLPFPGDDRYMGLLIKSITETPLPSIPAKYSQQLHQVLREHMLVRKVDKRATVDELCKLAPFDRLTRRLDKDLNSHIMEKGMEEPQILSTMLKQNVTQFSPLTTVQTTQKNLAPVSVETNRSQQGIVNVSTESSARVTTNLTATAKANPRASTGIGKPLSKAAVVKGAIRKNSALVAAAREGDLKRVIKLLVNGADVDSKDIFGETALMNAASNGHLEIVSQLLVDYAIVNSKDEFGWTPLMAAASNGHLEIVSQLLKNGADVNNKDYYGSTPLMKAASNGHLEIVSQLLAKGADVNSKNDADETALDYASIKKHEKIVELLKSNKNKIK